MSYTSFVFFIAYFGITYLLYTVVPKRQSGVFCLLALGHFILLPQKADLNIWPPQPSWCGEWGLLFKNSMINLKKKRKILKRQSAKS